MAQWLNAGAAGAQLPNAQRRAAGATLHPARSAFTLDPRPKTPCAQRPAPNA
jgi:hypothetical protein